MAAHTSGASEAPAVNQGAALSDANLIILAERELSAFARAVRELFGPEQASLSTAEWIDELEFLNWLARPGVSDFRRITIASSARLAHEMIPTRMRQGGQLTAPLSGGDQKGEQ
ncbi:MAG: hypothetical protein WBV28_04715 [Terracidiphilus sp.]